MKRFALLFLAVNFLVNCLPSGLVVSVFETGNLIEHFRAHRAESPEYGLSEFLTDHYSDSLHRESDVRHEKLPFHHHHHDQCCQLTAHSPVLLPAHFSAPVFGKLAEPIAEKPACRPETVMVSAFSGNIWEPPKV